MGRGSVQKTHTEGQPEVLLSLVLDRFQVYMMLMGSTLGRVLEFLIYAGL